MKTFITHEPPSSPPQLVVGGASNVWLLPITKKIEVELPHGQKLVIEDLETDVVVKIFWDADHTGVCIHSVMKEEVPA